MIPVYLDRDVYDRLADLADRQNLTVNKLLRRTMTNRPRKIHKPGSTEHLALCVAYARKAGWTDAEIRDHWGHELGLMKHQIQKG